MTEPERLVNNGWLNRLLIEDIALNGSILAHVGNNTPHVAPSQLRDSHSSPSGIAGQGGNDGN